MNKTQIDGSMREYNAGFFKDHYPKWTYQELLQSENPNKGATPQDNYRLQNHPGVGTIRDIRNDY